MNLCRLVDSHMIAGKMIYQNGFRIKLLLFSTLFLISLNSFAQPTSRLPSINKCAFLFQSIPTYKIFSSEDKQVEYEALGTDLFRNSIRSKGPFGQPMGVLVKNGVPQAFGTKSAVERLRKDIGELKIPLFDVSLLGGKDSFQYKSPSNEIANVKILPAVTGSALIERSFSDIDAELVLVTESRGFHFHDFYKPESVTIQSLEAFIHAHIKQNLKKGYAFSDFKAGEYDFIPEAAQDTKSAAIKWTHEELLNGFKMIPTGSETGPVKKLLLREALASQSRVKIDWVARFETDSDFQKKTGIQERYIEFSILIVFAGSRPGSTPILKLNSETQFPPLGATGAYLGTKNSATHLPVRITSIFFDPNHVELARKASVATPPPDLRHLNTVILNAAKTYFNKQDYLKTIKVLSTRLFYWNDFEYFKTEHLHRKITSTSHEVYQEMDKIIHNNDVMTLKALLEVGKGLALLTDVMLLDPVAQREYYQGLNKFFLSRRYINEPVKFSHINDAIGYVRLKLNEVVKDKINQQEDLKDYIDYVLSMEYANQYERYNSKNTFVTFELPTTFRESYSEKYFNQWSLMFPNLVFSRPNDLHMTLAFLGKIPFSKKERFEKMVSDLELVLKRNPISFEDGALSLVGRNNSQIAMVFPEHQLPAPVIAALMEFKIKAHKLGLSPDSHALDELLPHISVAHVRDAYFSPDSHFQITNLLMEAPIELESVKVSGRVIALDVEELPVEQPSQDRYSPLGSNLEGPPDFLGEDFH